MTRPTLEFSLSVNKIWEICKQGKNGGGGLLYTIQKVIYQNNRKYTFC